MIDKPPGVSIYFSVNNRKSDKVCACEDLTPIARQNLRFAGEKGVIMLLINRKLIRLALPSAGWILARVAVKLLLIVSIMLIYRSISGVQGQLYEGSLTIRELQTALLTMALVAVLRFLGNLIDGELGYQCASRTRLKLRSRVYQKLLELEVGYSEITGTSNAVTAAVDGIESLETYFSDYLPVLLYCFIAPFIMFGRVYRISPTSAWVLFAAAILVMPLNQLFKNVVKLLSGEYWSNFAKLNAFYLESLEGMMTFKLFGVDGDRSKALHERSWTFRNSIMKTMRLNFNAATLTETVIYVSMAAAVIIGAGRLENGVIRFGRAIYLWLLTDTFFAPARAMLRTSHTAMNGVAVAENVFGLLQTQPAHRRKKAAATDPEPGFRGIRVRNLSFAYESGRQVLRDLNIDIAENRTTALVGLSGCGKITLAAMLMRFFDPDEGSIFLNGTDVESIPMEKYRKLVSIVPQNSYIFSGSIADNLRFAKPGVTEEEMLRVCSMVKLDGFLKNSPEGLDTQVGEGGQKLSGGQRQKLGIARVLLNDSDIYIFDESTSNVDSENEEDIWDCIHSLDGQKTVIIITHRLSTIRRADQICVIEHGSITESGSYDELGRGHGLFARLLTEQAELERFGAGGITA